MDTAYLPDGDIRHILENHLSYIKVACERAIFVNLEQTAGIMGELKKRHFALGRVFAGRASIQQCLALLQVDCLYDFYVYKIQPLEIYTEEERLLIASIEREYAKGPDHPDFARHLLLVHLFLAPYRHSFMADWENVPDACLKSFLNYQFNLSPQFYLGDSKKIYDHLRLVLEKMLEFIEGPRTSTRNKLLAIECFLNKFDINGIMMSDQNLRPIMTLRYKIFTYIIREHMKLDLDWPAMPTRQVGKVRLGIVAKTMLCGGETQAMLAHIKGLDKNKYEIILFCFNLDLNYGHNLAYYRDLVNAVDDIVALASSDVEDAVKRVRGYNLDILWHQSHLGISETSVTAILFMNKLARVQCQTYAMNGVTSANPYFQYYINVEPTFLPKTWEGEFTERELNVSGLHIYIPEQWLAKPNRIITREMLGIPEDSVVYFGGAANKKYSVELLEAWVDVLKKVPNSYLVLYPFNPAWGSELDYKFAFHAMLQSVLAKSGVYPGRVRLVENVNAEAIIAMHSWGHVYLSSFPYGGVTSLRDALRGGLCTICRAGTWSRENGDANILASYELSDLITRSTQEFILLAVKLGLDEAYRTKTQARVRHAWDTKHGQFEPSVSASYAAVIDQIVEDEGWVSSSEKKPRVVVASA